MNEITDQILTFWFGTRDDDESVSPQPFWFKSTPEIDAELKNRFDTVYVDLVAGEFNSSIRSADDHLAAVLVLDQFPRNMYRGTPQAFAADGMARGWTRRAICAGHDVAQNSPNRRLFFYMPLEHSESLADQDLCVRLMKYLGIDEYTRYAHLHREVIEEFGRFPHRNAILGRQSSESEMTYLKQPGAGF